MTTYTCPVCSEVFPTTEKEKVVLAFLYGLCHKCRLKGEIERANTIDHIAKGRQIKKEAE